MSSDSLPFFFKWARSLHCPYGMVLGSLLLILLLIYNSQMLPIPPLDHILQAVANYAAPYPTYHPLASM